MGDSQQFERRLAAILAADVAGYTRLMEADEAATVTAWRDARIHVIDPMIAEHGGRVVKLTGDGFIAEYSTVDSAVGSAVAMQQAFAARNDAVPDDRRLAFRMGINIGDIYADRDDIYGDGVNLAARLESLADPGGICVSADIYNQLHRKSKLAFSDLGKRDLKNISAPVHVYGIELPGGIDSRPTSYRAEMHQDIRFCHAEDGTGLAYSKVGEGPPVVKAATWLAHLEFDFQSPVWRPWITALSDGFTLIRYDHRGTGLSDWDTPEISLEAWLGDFETVVDAAGLDTFGIIGISQGATIGAAYAARHPERVSHLVCYGGTAVGLLTAYPEMREEEMALRTLFRAGWGSDHPIYSRILGTRMVPEGTDEEIRWFTDLQRMSTTPENAVRIREVLNTYDVRGSLASIRCPTLVVHRREDYVLPFEMGRAMAAGIPNARFVALDGKNHVVLENEPQWPRFIGEVKDFLASGR